MADAKQEFIDLYRENIKREGSEKLLDFLLSEKSDFFSAPASTKFHLAEEGGLCQHSVNVYKRLKALVKLQYGDNYSDFYSDDTIAVCGLLHDLCKIKTYVVEYRNTKDDGGNWIKKPFYTTDEDLPYGHGEKSVYIINGFIRLERYEAVAINWHMGGFDDRARGVGSSALAKAYETYPLAVLLNMADMMASYLDESRTK